MNYKDFFKNKKITVLGLGLLGRGVNVTKFLAECGADLIVTDLKTKRELKDSLKKLKNFKNIKYTLGEHRLEDFKNRDFILKAAGVPLDSPYIKEAHNHDIPVEMDASLFAKFFKGMIVGVTGTRGKSTVTQLLYEILKEDNRSVHLGGNVRGVATLPLLKIAKDEDIVVMELDSWQLEGFGEAKISPHIAIFTNFMPDHMNYYKGDMSEYFKDKANIFTHQDKEDYLVTSEEVLKEARERGYKTASRIVLYEEHDIPKDWKLKLQGKHNKYNIASAQRAALVLGVGKEILREVIERFDSVPGRLELIKNKKGVLFYNDTTSTTPVGTIAALNTLGCGNKNIILIAGGEDKNLEYKEMVDGIIDKTKSLALFPGSATEKIKELLPGNYRYKLINNMKEAVEYVTEISSPGDIVLLSPGATSFGIFQNEFDRGDQFTNLVKNI